ncbi:DUF4166 domain-containing protein [Cnuibacter physcomitrellae]|uniref:DUF4166 domain-containing protein n=1 Tax=Cnuibacter physcomitrellae TaxID=1619308 RepID=UPI002175ACF5|nr:DUF4166 domain-containing protein [Cnuibacter physcomitrellae]MCS5496935.1 DUF4166 domain-containing protein [Cnuibacter physcomitrellae]
MPSSERATDGSTQPHSPFERALGPEAVAALHPRLRAYVGAIPAGHHGVGRGTYEVAGSRRRWLRPVLAVLAREQVLFPAHQRDVPFRIRNDEGPWGRRAQREFGFLSGRRTMVDEVHLVDGRLVDDIGSHRRFRAELEAGVDDGALVLTSTRMLIRVGRHRIPLPRRWSPRLHLVERFDDAAGRQRVDLVLVAPAIGRLYEYRGTFEYRIVGGEDAG